MLDTPYIIRNIHNRYAVIWRVTGQPLAFVGSLREARDYITNLLAPQAG